ncbi:MAG: epoxyqueuosine reductase QueH [Oscillospiraceae bacterium]|nr:epoxyqueuosine reductase QueH [Oscillospiraceae bacterium]
MEIKRSKTNYQIILDKTLSQIDIDNPPSLLLHSCCAPCSSYVLEYLSNYFKITVFYYNPNITEKEEYEKRVAEQKRFIEKTPRKNPVSFVAGVYEPEKFFSMAKGLEQEPEQGSRCHLCYEMRLREAGLYAKQNGFDYFTTTLTISPMKNSDVLNSIGATLSTEIGVPYLYSDFKKKNGYKRSIELSKEYNLYRQDYCGCIYSKNK